MSDESSEKVLAVQGLHKVFKDFWGRSRVKAVNGVDFEVRRGEVFGLLGPNGSGKTTCFYSIAGLVMPDGGQVLIDGVDVTNFPMYRRAKLGIGYLPQERSIF